ncbi:MAG: hypothetical protein WA058_01515 [Minisyncoccia bacterium]
MSKAVTALAIARSAERIATICGIPLLEALQSLVKAHILHEAELVPSPIAGRRYDDLNFVDRKPGLAAATPHRTPQAWPLRLT